MHRDVSSQMCPSLQWQKLALEGNFVKSYHKFIEFNLFFVHLISFWIDELIHFYSIYVKYEYRIPFMIWKLQTFSNVSAMKVFEFRLQFHRSLFPNGPIDCKSAMVWVMDWASTGEKPWPKSMLTQFTDAYIRPETIMHISIVVWDTALGVGGNSLSYNPLRGIIQFRLHKAGWHRRNNT